MFAEEKGKKEIPIEEGGEKGRAPFDGRGEDVAATVASSLEFRNRAFDAKKRQRFCCFYFNN